MAIEIHLPDIGADSADVTEILVNVGDAIEVDSPLISVEGDKAAMEVPSPKAGTVTEIKVAVGDSISTAQQSLLDQVLAVLARDTAAEVKAMRDARAAIAAVKAWPQFKNYDRSMLHEELPPRPDRVAPPEPLLRLRPYQSQPPLLVVPSQ